MKRAIILLACLAGVAQAQDKTLPQDYGYKPGSIYPHMETLTDGDDEIYIQPGFIGGWFWVYAWDEPVSLWFNESTSDTTYTDADSVCVPAAVPVAHNIRIFTPSGSVLGKVGMRIRLMEAAATSGRVTVIVYPHLGGAQESP
jgi:hypothetical protein